MYKVLYDIVGASFSLFLSMYLLNNIDDCNVIVPILWLILCLWLVRLIIDSAQKDSVQKRIGAEVVSSRGFEVVSLSHRKHPTTEITLPSRGTKHAMAYDFYAPTTYEVKPNDIVKIWTDVKTYMKDNEGLLLNIRSSMGGRFMLANTQGWIDRDYYNNESNDGNIGIFLKNITDEVITINKGDRIAQGMFVNFLVANNGNTDTIRKGGFGSTN